MCIALMPHSKGLHPNLLLIQSQQIPYEVVPTIEPLHHARDIMIDSQEIGLHAWLLNNVLPNLAHIVPLAPISSQMCT